MIFSQPDFSVQPNGAPIQPESLFACFRGMEILLNAERMMLPTFAELSALLPADCEPFELAHTDSHSVFTFQPSQPLAVPSTETLQYFSINIFRSLPYETAALITTSWHLWSWYQNNRFCGKCGSPLLPCEQERALRCSHCARMIFPTISPAVITAITCGDRILLARNANSPFSNYALVAGYVEVGETLEHAVRREALEEVGVHLKAVRYLGDQPWGVSGSHMFAFQAEADDKEPLIIQKNELSDARWFHRSELVRREHAVSIAFELIERFRKGEL